MRYYKIVITDPNSGAIVRPTSLGNLDPSSTWSSFVGGKNLPGALNVEMDILVFQYATPNGASYIKIWGVSLAEIGQPNDLNGKKIAVYGGMQKGLPLANPQQAGLLIEGMIFQAFGNWIDNNMSIDLIVLPDTGTPESPKNIVFDWAAGTPMGDAISTTLKTAFPKLTATVNINANLTQQRVETGFYSTLEQFASYVKSRSASLIGGDYDGVDITILGSNIVAFDSTTEANPKMLEFKDMIGQPTWIDPLTIQTKFVMRSDLHVGDIIKFPSSPVTTSSNSASPLLNQKLQFQGAFQIQAIRHVGNFRQPDAASWNTTVDAFTRKSVSTLSG